MNKFTYIIPVHGTWLPEKDWWLLGSDFYTFAAQNNILYFVFDNESYEPFNWSGDVDGFNWLSLFTLGLKKDKHTDWIAGGKSFKSYVRYIPLKDRNLIIHSHGLQVITYSGVILNNVITVGSPIRNDLMGEYKKLRANCKNWMHIYDSRWDRMGFMGQIFDGKFLGSRACLIDGVKNCPQTSIGHSNILRDKKLFSKWNTEGWFDFLRQ